MEVQATMEKLKERIKDKKYKLTTQRQIILQTFIEAEEKHLSAEDVYIFSEKEQSRYWFSYDLPYIGLIH